MSDRISITATFTVNDGKLEELRSVVPMAVEAAEQNPGCLAYEAWTTDDGKVLHWHETYRDSESAMLHLHNIQDVAPQIMACATPTGFTVYGSPSEQVRDAVKDFGMVYMMKLGGFAR